MAGGTSIAIRASATMMLRIGKTGTEIRASSAGELYLSCDFRANCQPVNLSALKLFSGDTSFGFAPTDLLVYCGKANPKKIGLLQSLQQL